jgi:hypothetical protein
MVVGLVDPRMKIEIEVTARRSMPAAARAKPAGKTARKRARKTARKKTKPARRGK